MFEWFRIVEEAGIKARVLDPFSVYLIAGKIINDPEVRKRRLHSDTRTVLAAMTHEEREALISRVQV